MTYYESIEDELSIQAACVVLILDLLKELLKKGKSTNMNPQNLC